MKRLLILLLFCAAPAFGQGVAIFDPAGQLLSGAGRPIQGASVTVCSGSTLPAAGALCTTVLSAASLYSDIGLTLPIANPVTSDGYGNYGPFYVAPGAYVFTISGPGLTTFSFPYGTNIPATALSSITPLTAANSLANGNWPLTLNWAQTTPSQTALSIGETTAATGSGDVEVAISTLAGSTAVPLTITQVSNAAGSNPNAFTLTGAAGFVCVNVNCNGGSSSNVLWNLGLGGNAGATLGTGGAGGGVNIGLGYGGASSGNRTAGSGGTFTLSSGNGGAATSGNGVGGAGGDFILAVGNGGASTGTGVNARGGNVSFSFAGPGTGGSGTAGAPGQFNLLFASVNGNLTSCFICMTGIWNTTGVVDAAILANITTTAQGSASKLMDLQSRGTSEFNVDYQGNGTFNGTGTFANTVTGTDFIGTIGATTPKAGTFTALSEKTVATATNCAGVGTAASPSIASCGSASAGHFSCSTAATGATCQVNTTAVTANSEIFVFESDTAVTGTALGVTCNTSTTVNPTTRLLASSVAATSFTINLGTVTTNPACFSYFIVN